MNRLTHKQQAFAENVASGLTYTQAYREAYNCPTAKPKTIRTEASRLANDPKIVEAIEEMVREIRWARLVGADGKLDGLRRELQNGATERDKLKAVIKLGKVGRV